MIGLLFALGAVALGLAIAGPTETRVTSLDVSSFVRKSLGLSDAGAIRGAARTVELAGYPMAAAALRDRAAQLGQNANVRTHTVAAAAPGVPLPGVSPASWVAFVRRMVVQPPGAVGPKGQIGLFGFQPRRLAELGVTDDPIVRAALRSSKRAQCLAFGRCIADLGGKVKSDPVLTAALGRELAGARVTLSGLCALAHVAGLTGARKWVSSEGDREKYQQTTTIYKRTTGIF
jgi:hypothetical protein